MNQIHSNSFSSIEQMSGQYLQKRNTAADANSDKKVLTFQEILSSKESQSRVGSLKFSKHANERLIARQIDLSDAQLERLESGAKKAGEKGIRESLVLIDNLAFIINVKNNTVITAVNDDEDKIFTNIDGAVVM